MKRASVDLILHAYGLGESERIFGQLLSSRDIDRKDVDIINKGGMGMDRYGDPDRPLLIEADLIGKVDDNMKTLTIDTIDNTGESTIYA